MSGDPVLAALGRLLDGQARLEERLTGLEEKQATLENGQTRLRVDLMERMDRLDNRMTAFRTEVMTGFEKVEDRFTEMRDGSIVNFARADRAIDTANRNERELRDMWRTIHRMQARLDDLDKLK